MPRSRVTRDGAVQQLNAEGKAEKCVTGEFSGLVEAHKRLFQNQGIGAGIFDLEGRCVSCNPALARLSAEGGGDGAYLPLSEKPGSLRSRLAEINFWKRIEKRGGVSNQEIEISGKNGKKIHLLASAAVIGTAHHDNRFVFLSVVNVNRFKKIQRDMQRAIENVSSMAASLQDQLREKEEALAVLREEFEEARRNLKRVNEATGLLTARMREQTQDYQNRIIHDFNLTVRPLMDHLKSLHPAGPETHLLEAMDFNMRHIASQFGVNLAERQVRLSRREAEICSMIRAGQDSRQIAGALGVAYQTIIVHRKNIRKKLGLKRNKQNLATFILDNM